MTQRFHGLSLAANSVFENFNVERLAADPLPIGPGRLWFNTTDKALKFSSLDVGGAVTINVIADSASMQLAINSLQTSLNNEIAARGDADTTEMNARVAAINALQTALAAEVADRTNADAAESQARIDGDAAEAAARTAAIAVASATAANATATETAARLAGDAAQTARSDSIQSELDAVEVGAGLNVDGTYTAPENTTYLGTVVSLKDADVKLDKAIGDEVAARITATAALQSALNNEAQLRADGDANLQAQLQAWVNTQIANDNVSDAEKLLVETNARIAAVAGLQTELDATQAAIGLNPDGTSAPITGTNYLNGTTTVFGGAFALDTQLKVVSDAVAAEGVARATADSNFHDQLQQETADRAAADTALQQELNTTQAGAGLETSGAYVALVGSNYLGAATTLKDADAKLDAALKSVDGRVTAVETVSIPNLQSQITAEVSRATAAESAESAARTTAVADLNSAISQEVTDRTAAVATVTAAVATEATTARAAESGLQSQINAIVAASGEGAAALKTELNASRFTYKSSAPALVHTITHNMGTEFYSCNIMVQDQGGVWRNDIMPIEDIDLNSFKVTLSEACNIKASGQSNDPVGGVAP